MKKNNLKTILILLIIASAITDFFPSHEGPHFRYNGSNPLQNVLNLGTPLTLMIIDIQNAPYLFFSPESYVMIPLQLIIILGLVFLLRLLPKS
ncbi:hypothetical protein FNJ87_18645 [Nonlabens mediterrranea]|uniref:Uncharacterized protein n=1 Tax=Nonlabens mediterrranea TaxID=1419947 RepID=A0ABS0AA34_9FLAO|nr:hypothetical protein [Nonlabens mediterrranea]MBF4986242.1 hypothetical protein [Nonlabens mediterrranea]